MKQLNGDKQMTDVWPLPAKNVGKNLAANTPPRNHLACLPD